MPAIYVLSKNKINIKFFHLKIIIFTALKNHCILYKHVCVMFGLTISIVPMCSEMSHAMKKATI